MLEDKESGNPSLRKNTKKKQVYFSDKYENFEWKRAVSTDECKGKKSEFYSGKYWRKPGEQLDPNIIGRKTQDDDKSMCTISGAITWGHKSDLTFLYTETDEQKDQAKEILQQENEGNDPMNIFTFVCAQEHEKLQYERTGKKKPGPPAKLENYVKNQQYRRGDRAKGGVDGFRYW